MKALVRVPLIFASLMVSAQALAQSAAPQPATPSAVASPVYAQPTSSPPAGTSGLPTAAPSPPPQFGPAPGSPPMGYQPSMLAGPQGSVLGAGLSAARSGNLQRAETYRAELADPIARDLVRWAEVDSEGSELTFSDLDAARRDLGGWPHSATRELWAERALLGASMAPSQVITWFDGQPPTTAEGAMSLAGALQASGQTADAQTLIRSWWREHLFDAGIQARMLARYGAWLTPADHSARLRSLLLGPQGPALQGVLPLVSEDERRLADAAIAFRVFSSDAQQKLAATPTALQSDPVLNFERARYLRHFNMETLGFSLVHAFPPAPVGDEETSERMWLERRNYFNAALRTHDWQTAYAAVTHTGFASGERKVEAEFFAGWVALAKLHDAALADTHFAALQRFSSTPITQGRAAYWRGRAAEARGDTAAAAASYSGGAKYITSFYGQLSAEKAGVKTLVLPHDPTPTAADRQRFESRNTVRAARMLYEAGQRDLFKLFVLACAETLPSAEETALLVDLARYYGDQDLAMRTVRIGAQRGFVLAERGYPVLPVPESPGAAEPAFALSIARQESNFFPYARSNANARGIMQLLPGTARRDAARLGIGWSEGSLYDAAYNMRLGAYELGEMISLNGGSYVMAAAAYNAGPSRPPLWVTECGDPRGAASDPVDFIECIPFTETRNYVMRTLETTQIYRARLNAGAAPLTLAEDLRRGAYGFIPPPEPPVTTPMATIVLPAGPAPILRASYDEAPVAREGCRTSRARSRRGHRAHAASSRCPRGVATHSASSRKTSARFSGHKASRGSAHAIRRPADKRTTRSAKRAHKFRS